MVNRIEINGEIEGKKLMDVDELGQIRGGYIGRNGKE